MTVKIVMLFYFALLAALGSLPLSLLIGISRPLGMGFPIVGISVWSMSVMASIIAWHRWIWRE